MFVVHASRIERVRVPPSGLAELCDRLVSAFRWAEPFIAAAFLFIAGYSLVLSQRGRARRDFLPKILRRVALLYALSVVLFVPQYGTSFPDLVLSSGILSAIALAIAMVGLGLVTDRPVAALLSVALVVLAATAALDVSGATVSGLNAGPGGAFPLVAFAAVGALSARLIHARGLSALAWSCLGLCLLTLAVWDARLPWLTERNSLYPAGSAASVLGALLRGGSPGAALPVAFWNHSAAGALGLLAPLGVSLLLVLVAQRALPGLRLFAPVLLLGRNALLAYVLHLALLGLLDAFELAPQSPTGTLGLVLLLAVFSCAVGLWLERRASLASARARYDRAPA